MNFLSHYYFERYDRDPERIFGSVFPDLLRNADRDFHLHPEKHELQFLGNPKLTQINRGWQRHMEIDRLFHNADFFYEETHTLKVLIGSILEGTPIRPSFLSHIALELMLDHLLLVEGIVDENDFYLALEQVDRTAVGRFLEICEFRDGTPFFAYLDGFLRHRYVGSYRDLSQVSQALMHICRRLWDFERDLQRKAALTIALGTFAQGIRGRFHVIFEEIEQKLT